MNDVDWFRPISTTTLSDDWGVLTKHVFDLRRRDGVWQQQTREVYDRGNGATCLLHNPDTDCVLLTRQFRLPVFVTTGRGTMIEAPAGLLDGADPDDRMRQELMEETGFLVDTLCHLFDLHMSPGSVTEYLAFYTGTYGDKDRSADGGGAFEEGEDIEVLEVPLPDAMRMIETGDIRDAKTIILLQKLWIERLSTSDGD